MCRQRKLPKRTRGRKQRGNGRRVRNIHSLFHSLAPIPVPPLSLHSGTVSSEFLGVGLSRQYFSKPPQVIPMCGQDWEPPIQVPSNLSRCAPDQALADPASQFIAWAPGSTPPTRPRPHKFVFPLQNSPLLLTLTAEPAVFRRCLGASLTPTQTQVPPPAGPAPLAPSRGGLQDQLCQSGLSPRS